MRVFGILLLIGVVGAAPSAAQVPSGAPVVAGPGAAAVGPVGTGAAASNMVVRPGDQLLIAIWPDTELGGTFTIEETGLVYLPVLGAVQVAGQGIAQIRSDLRQGYAQSMRGAVVEVMPLVRVSVIGAVSRPGVYMVPPTESAVDVILRAGGFNDQADQNKIEIVRGGQSIAIHAGEAIRSVSAETMALQSNDWIVVPARKKTFSVSTLNVVFQIVTLATILWSHFAD